MDKFIQPYITHALSLSTAELDQKLSTEGTFLLPRPLHPRLSRSARPARRRPPRRLRHNRRHPIIHPLRTRPQPAHRPQTARGNRFPTGSGHQRTESSYTDLKEMMFLNAVINETMRICPVVPFNVRYFLRDMTLPRGGGKDGLAPVGIRAGTRVVYSALIMQRDPRHYDPPGSPNHFDPGNGFPSGWCSGSSRSCGISSRSTAGRGFVLGSSLRRLRWSIRLCGFCRRLTVFRRCWLVGGGGRDSVVGV